MCIKKRGESSRIKIIKKKKIAHIGVVPSMSTFLSPPLANFLLLRILSIHPTIMINQLHSFLEVSLLLLIISRVSRQSVQPLRLYGRLDGVVPLRQRLPLGTVATDNPFILQDILFT